MSTKDDIPLDARVAKLEQVTTVLTICLAVVAWFAFKSSKPVEYHIHLAGNRPSAGV